MNDESDDRERLWEVEDGVGDRGVGAAVVNVLGRCQGGEAASGM